MHHHNNRNHYPPSSSTATPASHPLGKFGSAPFVPNKDKADVHPSTPIAARVDLKMLELTILLEEKRRCSMDFNWWALCFNVWLLVVIVMSDDLGDVDDEGVLEVRLWRDLGIRWSILDLMMENLSISGFDRWMRFWLQVDGESGWWDCDALSYGRHASVKARGRSATRIVLPLLCPFSH